jgi:hypothetical protein
MTRKNDDKRGGQDSNTGHNAKVEARFTKEAKAKTDPSGSIRADRMGRDFADNTGGRGHRDVNGA